MSQPSPPLQPKQRAPIDVKSRIQKYQQATTGGTDIKPQEDNVPKSKSFHDLRSMTLVGEDGWVMASDGRTQRETSPVIPPKPLTRKKKFETSTEQSASPVLTVPSNVSNVPSPTTPAISSKLGATDLFLLPTTQKTSSTKSLPPRPPPPYMKPTRRNTEKRQQDITTTATTTVILEESNELSSNKGYTKNKPPDLLLSDGTRDRKSSGADTKSSEDTSSLSDSIEDDKTNRPLQCKTYLNVIIIIMFCL